MGAVYLDAVEACLHGSLGCVTESLYDCLYLVFCHLSGCPVLLAVLAGAGPVGLMDYSGVVELCYYVSFVFVDCVCEFFKHGDMFVVADARHAVVGFSVVHDVEVSFDWIAAPGRLVAQHGKRTVILIDDGTRPTPQNLILPILLDELSAAGVADGDICVMVALGTHRPMSREELITRVGEAVFERVEVINLPQDPEDFADLGVTPLGIPIHVSRRYLGERDQHRRG